MALAQRLWKAMSRHYQKNVAGRVFPPPPPPTAGRRRSLSEFGLKYDDIRIESDADYAKALDRLQQRVQIKFHAPSAPLVERISTSRNRPHQQHDRIAAVERNCENLFADIPHSPVYTQACRTRSSSYARGA